MKCAPYHLRSISVFTPLCSNQRGAGSRTALRVDNLLDNCLKGGYSVVKTKGRKLHRCRCSSERKRPRFVSLRRRGSDNDTLSSPAKRGPLWCAGVPQGSDVEAFRTCARERKGERSGVIDGASSDRATLTDTLTTINNSVRRSQRKINSFNGREPRIANEVSPVVYFSLCYASLSDSRRQRERMLRHLKGHITPRYFSSVSSERRLETY